MYTLSGFYICPPRTIFSLLFLLSFSHFPYFQLQIFLNFQSCQFFNIFPFLIFQTSILPVFLILSNYISFTFPILRIFLFFSNFIFSKVPIFLTFLDFLFSSFHTFNFFNSFSLLHTNSSSPILSFHTSFHLNIRFSQIPPRFYLTLQFSQIFRSSSVSFQLCSLHFTAQLYTFFPLFSPILLVPYSSYFNSPNYSFFRYFFFVQRFSVYSAPFVIPSFPGGPARRRACLSLSLQTCPSFTWDFPRTSTIVRMTFEAT